MGIDILLEMLSDLLYFAMVAYLTGRSWFIMKCVHDANHPLGWFFLSVLFSCLSVIGSYDAIPWGGYMTSTRLASIIVGGFLGGPVVGACVGVISGVHLMLLHGVSVSALAIISLLSGVCAGLLKSKNNMHKMNWRMGAGVAFVAESVQYGAVDFVARFSGADVFVNNSNMVATALVSVLGVVIFFVIIDLIAVEQDVYGAKAAQLSLAIASRTLPYLRQGLTPQSAQITADTIYQLAKVDGVCITDKEHVIAQVGVNGRCDKPGDPIMEYVIKRAIQQEKIVTSLSVASMGREIKTYPLCSHVVAPLLANGVVVGAIKLTRIGTDTLSELDMRIADGLATLLSVQVQLADSDRQRKMREKAELRALRAQINPHFLFNTMSIIMSFCRTNPERARKLLGNMVTMMKQSFANHDDFVILSEELAVVSAFLEIAKSRFGDRLQVEVAVEEGVLHIPIPVFSLQPLVENAVQHGLFPKADNCRLRISACTAQDKLAITIADNGVGMHGEDLKKIYAGHADGVGIRNVHQRLISIYGSDYGLQIDSEPNEGTRVTICIPYHVRDKSMAGGVAP